MMSTALGTRDLPLKFARALTAIVQKEWEDGTYLEKVTPITADLLRYWFDDAFMQIRDVNYHDGQKQAILNAIYVHEVLKCDNVIDMYHLVQPELPAEMGLLDLTKEKYDHPKYCVKMATGTGKTWVMHSLMIWQYLNARHEEAASGRYTQNFLLIAPGLIVYERLLDAYLGKETDEGKRDFNRSDFKTFQDLFIPPAYRDEMFGFIQSSVAKKNEIGRKITGEGLIAITNWHLLAEEEEVIEGTPLDNPWDVAKANMPILPGQGVGQDLNTLDAQYLSGKELNYLSSLKDIVVFNDEAHHLGEFKKSGEVLEKKWQEALLRIAKPKGSKYIQIDFSATPYQATGGTLKRQLHYFPHVIVDFDLNTAIRMGLVKTIALDKRKEIGAIPLDFKAERDQEGDVIALSEGQRTMLRAGLKKLRILEEQFVAFDKDKEGKSDKYPKMLVICEDISIVEYISDFLIKYEELSEEDILEVHSNKKGEIGLEDWEKLKHKLFNIDKHAKPKVIISVLMLREGFDVNNICVIVPLRSSSSPILLEQTVGRGLRLMWRNSEYEDLKRENRIRLLDRKEQPSNYLDILSIVEHPMYAEFYDKFIQDGIMGAVTDELKNDKGSVLGDIIKVPLKENYKEYDLYIPQIIRDKEENLKTPELSYAEFEQFPVKLDVLKDMIGKRKGDTFYSEEITVKTRFGEYQVTSEIFNAKGYNDFLSKVVNAVLTMPVIIGSKRAPKMFPTIQINTAKVMAIVDGYIRNKLFGQTFDPFDDDNWRVLMLPREGVVSHIIRNISKAIYELQTNIEVSEAEIVKKWFSEIPELKMRENYAIDVSKCIYEKLYYPSNRGGFEKDFIEFVDSDSQVKSFIKISENYHHFANIIYIRDDGLLARYYPDFLVNMGEKVYIVETKAQVNLSNENVKQKRLATIDLVNKINQLKPEDRMDAEWTYVVLGDKTFYEMKENGGWLKDILEYTKITKSKVEGTLGDYIR